MVCAHRCAKLAGCLLLVPAAATTVLTGHYRAGVLLACVSVSAFIAACVLDGPREDNGIPRARDYAPVRRCDAMNEGQHPPPCFKIVDSDDDDEITV